MTKLESLRRLLETLRSQQQIAEFQGHFDEAARLDRRIQHVEKLLAKAGDGD